MKLDLLLAQNSDKIMWAGDYYSLLVIFVHDTTGFPKIQNGKSSSFEGICRSQVYLPTKTFSSSVRDNSVFNPE